MPKSNINFINDPFFVHNNYFSTYKSKKEDIEFHLEDFELHGWNPADFFQDKKLQDDFNSFFGNKNLSNYDIDLLITIPKVKNKISDYEYRSFYVFITFYNKNNRKYNYTVKYKKCIKKNNANIEYFLKKNYKKPNRDKINSVYISDLDKFDFLFLPLFYDTLKKYDIKGVDKKGYDISGFKNEKRYRDSTSLFKFDNNEKYYLFNIYTIKNENLYFEGLLFIRYFTYLSLFYLRNSYKFARFVDINMPYYHKLPLVPINDYLTAHLIINKYYKQKKEDVYFDVNCFFIKSYCSPQSRG